MEMKERAEGADPRLVGAMAQLLAGRGHRHYAIEVCAATLVFFVCFSSIVLFSPSIAVLAPLNNFTATQSSVLIALPTITATLTRIPLSLSTTYYGVLLPLAAAQCVALAGLLCLCLVIYLAPASPSLYGAYCFLALIIGVAGSAFPLTFLQCSYWTPEERQGTSIAAFTGVGAMGTSVFTLVLPFLISAIGLGGTYVIWFAIQLLVILFIVVVMRNPPYLRVLLELRRNGAEVLYDWGDEKQLQKHDAIAPRSAAALKEAESGAAEMEISLGKKREWNGLVVAVNEIREIASREGQGVFSKSDLRVSLRLAMTNWRVWTLFGLQFSTFGAGVSSLAIWGPTYFRVSFGMTNQLAAVITFCFGICCSVRVLFGPIFDRLSVRNSHLLGFASALIQGGLVFGAAFCGSFEANVFLWMISGIFYGLANTALFYLVNVHEPRAQTGAIGLVSSGIIGGAVISACFGPIVSSFPASDAAFAVRFCLVLPAAVCCVGAFGFLLLLIPARPVPRKMNRAATFAVIGTE
jgi:NNP family nitrate/nitrite transporter-like MFS transporter